jgi:hypothetical protein
MLPAPEPGSLPTDADRLNGWKEIASFLGKGIRTAQRWERDFGLPVRRLGANGGEIVFASKSEIAQWMLTAAHARAKAGTVTEDARDAGPGRAADVPRVTERDREPGARRQRPTRTGWWLAASIVIVAGAAGAWWISGRPRAGLAVARRPTGWDVQDNRLSVLDESGRLLWSRHIDAVLHRPSYHLHPGEVPPAARVRVEDVDDDGSREVLFAVMNFDTPRPGLLVFNADGSLRFAHSPPDAPIRFGDLSYAPDWNVQGTWTTINGNGEHSIWVLYYHKPYFPSLLVQLDPQGRTRSQYVSNGYITSVADVRWGGRDVVLVGAANNETRGASLAVFEGHTVRGSAPAGTPKYRCTNCPPGAPDLFVTFPRGCLSMGPGDTARVARVWRGAQDRIWADVEHGSFLPPSKLAAGSIVYELGPGLVPVRAEIGGNYVLLHRQELEARNAVDHPVGPRDQALAFPVRIWNGARFEDLPAAPVEVDR